MGQIQPFDRGREDGLLGSREAFCCAGRLMTAYLNAARGQPRPIRSDASRLADPVGASGGVSLRGEPESTKCNHNGEHRHIGYL